MCVWLTVDTWSRHSPTFGPENVKSYDFNTGQRLDCVPQSLPEDWTIEQQGEEAERLAAAFDRYIHHLCTEYLSLLTLPSRLESLAIRAVNPSGSGVQTGRVNEHDDWS